MNKLLSLAVLMTVFLVWACGSSEEKTTVQQNIPTWEFEKMDSLQVELIGTPVLADAEFGKILLYDPQKREFLILDEQGSELYRFVKTGDAPDNFGFNLLLPGFLSESEVMMAGSLGIFVYDLSGKFIKKIPHPEPQSGGTFTDYPGKSIDHFSLNGKNKILSKSMRMFDSSLGDKEFYSKYRGLEVIDAAIGTGQALAPFPSGSRYLNGNGFIQSDFEPAFAASESGVYLAFAGDPVLHQYGWSGDSLSLQKSIRLSLPDFGEITGQPLVNLEGMGFSTSMVTAAIRKVTQWKNLGLVQFFPGFSSQESAELDLDYQAGRREEARAKVQKLYETRKMGLAIVDLKTSTQLGIISFPNWVNSNGFVQDGENFWFQKAFNPEQEEDFLKIYKVKLVEK